MNRSLRTLALFSGETQQPSPQQDSKNELPIWMAVCLIDLALESQGHAHFDAPTVIIEPRQGQLCVHSANRSAKELGIAPGLKLSAALAVADSLHVIERVLDAERASLESLAIWAHCLTPIVSLEFPDTLLLEVRGSTKLFGGISNIERTLKDQLSERNLSFRLCLAPTPRGALWLARHRSCSAVCHDELGRLLRALPLHATGWPDAVLSRLGDMGLSSVGECLRLPRDGFAKRVGVQYLQDLDRALGRIADPRVVIDFPRILSFRVDLPSETRDLAIILQAAESMIEKMTSALRSAQRQVRFFTFVFYYLRREPSSELFELIEADHEKQRFLNLLSDRLERRGLRAPAVALELKTGILSPMRLNEPDLFAKCDRSQGADRILLERLRERLGPRSVYGIALAEDHRPESAWSQRNENAATAGRHAAAPSPSANARPLWLLPVPRLLICNQGAPAYDGQIEIHAGPERIEGGWWDREDVRRDYYVASSKRGERLWIYFDRAEHAWYLHGIFG